MQRLRGRIAGATDSAGGTNGTGGITATGKVEELAMPCHGADDEAGKGTERRVVGLQDRDRRDVRPGDGVPDRASAQEDGERFNLGQFRHVLESAGPAGAYPPARPSAQARGGAAIPWCQQMIGSRANPFPDLGLDRPGR